MGNNIFAMIWKMRGKRGYMIFLTLVTHKILRSDVDAVDRALEPDAFPATAKLYYVLRLLMNVFMRNVPSLSNKPSSIRKFQEEKKVFIRLLI